MAQRTYGTTAEEMMLAPPDGVQENDGEVLDESQALLGGVTNAGGLENKPDSTKDGHATLASSVSNLSNTIIGSGVYPRSLSTE